MNVAQELIDSILADPSQFNRLAGAMGQSPLLKADAFTAGPSGQQLVWYDLEPTIKFLMPYLENVPLIVGNPARGIQPIPRVAANGGTATNWKVVNQLDPTRQAGGVGRGQRGAPLQIPTLSASSPYFGMGVEVPVDFETRYEGNGLSPEVLAIAGQAGLRALTLFEEQMLIGGNNSLALGTTPTPTVADGAASGGTITDGGGTLSVICVALTNDGLLRVFPGGVISAVKTTTQVPGVEVRLNVDGSSLTFGGGAAQKSAAGSGSVSSSHTMLAYVSPVSGAVAYAWFWGAAGSERLGAVTTLAGIEIKTDALAGTQLASALPASDQSKNAYIPDGIITQMVGQSFGGVSNSYIKSTANGTGAGAGAGKVGTGSGLTGDGAGGIVEFDAANLDRWNNYRMGFTRWLVNAQESQNITAKILTSPAGVTSLFRANQAYPTGANGPQAGLRAGDRVTTYHNKMTGQDQDIVVHPWVPPGTIIGWSDRVPYPLSNVPNIIQIKYRQGYYQIDWPLVTRQYQQGVYVDETVENYFPPAFGLITNLGNN